MSDVPQMNTFLQLRTGAEGLLIEGKATPYLWVQLVVDVQLPDGGVESARPLPVVHLLPEEAVLLAQSLLTALRRELPEQALKLLGSAVAQTEPLDPHSIQ
jgi:hypothetical protein